jgi:hypothetical protein
VTTRSMSMRWTKHLKDDQKKEFETRLVHAVEIFSVLKNIIEEDVRVIDKNMMSKESYDLDAWPFFQADQLGSKRTLLKLLDLIP